MLRINPVTNLDCKKPKSNTTFTSQNPITAQACSVPAIKPAFNVKAPMAYQKTGEVALPFDYKAHCYKLVNGQQVILVPKEGETVLKTYVSTGSMNEPDNLRGISHYIEHNLFNGSDGLNEGEFFKTVNKMGAETNASTGFAETNYYISSNLLDKEDLENKIKIHASMIETPKFSEDMLSKEKGIVNSEINMITSDPENILANKTIKQLYNIKSTSEDLIGGTTDNITRLSRQDVVDYYNNNYFPANMVTVVVGEINPDETINLISKHFSGNNKISQARKFEKLNPINSTVRQDIISDKTNATYIMLGFNGPENKNIKDKIYLSAIGELLNKPNIGRLDKELKNLNTGAVLQLEKVSSRPSDNCAILISSDSIENNSEKVLKTLFKQLHSVVQNPPTDEELAIIKKSLLAVNSFMLESSQIFNDLIGKSVLNGGLEYLTEYENIVNSMTKEDIVNAAKKYLDLNKCAVTVLHPQTADENSIKSNYAKEVSFGGNSVEKRAINPDNVQRYRLANNFDLVTNDIRTNNSSIDIKFETKKLHNINPAAAKILNGILQEGSNSKAGSEFQADLGKKGITAGFGSGSLSLSANALCSPKDIDAALNNLFEVLYNPRFTQETFDIVKQNLTEQYSKSDKNVYDKLYKELYKNHPIGVRKDDMLKAFETVTLDDVKTLYNHIISNAEAHATVSAPFGKNGELKNLLFNRVANLPAVEPPKIALRKVYTPVTETKVLTDVDDKNQARIVEAFKFKINGNIKDKVAINLMNIILGGNASSRLFNDLREKQQLAYRVNSKIKNIGDSGLLSLSIATTTENKATNEVSYDNVEKSINGFNKHINAIKNTKVTEEELESAKRNFKNAILKAAETSIGKNATISVSLSDFYGPLAINELLKTVDEITVDDIYNAANYIFNTKPTYSILATKNTLDANEEFLKSL